ncbi:MAG: TetR/AcrR family transcriptional regulator [Nitrosopumilus sp.]
MKTSRASLAAKPGKTVRDRIIKSATRNFSKKGYTNASMDDIAKSAKISKGGMYHYFGSKEELFLAVIFQDAETNMEKQSQFFKNKKDLLDDIGKYYDEIIDKPHDLIRIWLEGVTEAMHNPKLKKMLDLGRQQVEQVSVGMLRQMKKDLGVLQDYSDSELPELSRGILDLYKGMTLSRIMEDDPELIRKSWIKTMYLILTSDKQ